MNRLLVGTALLAGAAALAAAPVYASEATFERNLNLNGKVELSVATGAGYIHITHGADRQIHIFGRVKSGWGADESQVKQIADNPPIEQTGNIVRIGARHENLHNISIDYEIQAPADAYLNAASGSGDVSDDGVGENAKLSTGSGKIHATGLHAASTSTPAQVISMLSKSETATSRPKPVPAPSSCATCMAHSKRKPDRATSRSVEPHPKRGSLRRAQAAWRSGPATPRSPSMLKPAREASIPIAR